MYPERIKKVNMISIDSLDIFIEQSINEAFCHSKVRNIKRYQGSEESGESEERPCLLPVAASTAEKEREAKWRVPWLLIACAMNIF